MSWSGEGATLRSPLEQVWRQFIPQGHDAALRNAFYNVAAAGFVVVAGAAAWNVYLIFQPFVRALLWAVLCGSAIHPAKTAVVSSVRTWLNVITESSSSLSLATLLLPLHLLDTLSEAVGRYVVRHVRTMVVVTVVLPVVFILIHYTPTMLTSLLCWILTVTFNAVTGVMSLATSNKYIVVALVCCYIVSLFLFWDDQVHRVWLSRLSVAVWLLVGAGVAGWLIPPSATQPVFAVFCAVLLLGLVVEVLEYWRDEQRDDADSSSLVRSVVRVCKDDYQSPDKHDSGKRKVCTPSSGLEAVTEEEAEEQTTETATAELARQQREATEGSCPVVENVGSSVGDTQETEELSAATSAAPLADTPVSSSGWKTSKVRFADSSSTTTADSVDSVSTDVDDSSSSAAGSSSSAAGSSSSPAGGSSSPAGSSSQQSAFSADDSDVMDKSGSNIYIKGVFMACVLVELWRHHYLLILLPIAFVYLTIKKTTSVCLSGGSLGSAASSFIEQVWESIRTWTSARRDALVPPPVRGVKKVLQRSEAWVVQCISGSLDALVACCFILLALLFIVSAAIFLIVQIQGESMQLVGVASQIINATVVSNPQFIALLPDDISDTFTSAAENAYLYGRDWLTKWVRGLVGEADDAKAQVLEKQVLELWDRVYQAWVIAPPMWQATQEVHGPVVTSQAVADTFDKLVQGITNSSGLISLESLQQLLKDNVGTILSVAEGLWTLLLSNISLLLSLATTSASAVLGGSLSLLNGVISAVVFLSALFYVLASTSTTYKPVVILSNLAPGQMNSVGAALEAAINGVFMASLKMGVFYGLWTWLLHSIFATNIVYIPAVLGALFGAVPLVGTYWACIPGMLELWWGHNSPMLALLLLACQLAPLSCVDTAIYAEIKGGGHPYLTGLAVGGGIFCWGAEGAILGPLLLCILLVATNLYATLISPPMPQPNTSRFSRLRRSFSQFS